MRMRAITHFVVRRDDESAELRLRLKSIATSTLPDNPKDITKKVLVTLENDTTVSYFYSYVTGWNFQVETDKENIFNIQSLLGIPMVEWQVI